MRKDKRPSAFLIRESDYKFKMIKTLEKVLRFSIVSCILKYGYSNSHSNIDNYQTQAVLLKNESNCTLDPTQTHLPYFKSKSYFHAICFKQHLIHIRLVKSRHLIPQSYGLTIAKNVNNSTLLKWIPCYNAVHSSSTIPKMKNTSNNIEKTFKRTEEMLFSRTNFGRIVKQGRICHFILPIKSFSLFNRKGKNRH